MEHAPERAKAGIDHQTSALHVLSRLLEVLKEENAVLDHQRITSHANFAERKNQALRDMMTVQKVHPKAITQSEHGCLLRELKLALDRNASLLGYHIKAVNEISDIIIGSVREAESDGTYSSGVGTLRG